MRIKPLLQGNSLLQVTFFSTNQTNPGKNRKSTKAERRLINETLCIHNTRREHTLPKSGTHKIYINPKTRIFNFMYQAGERTTPTILESNNFANSILCKKKIFVSKQVSWKIPLSCIFIYSTLVQADQLNTKYPNLEMLPWNNSFGSPFFTLPETHT